MLVREIGRFGGLVLRVDKIAHPRNTSWLNATRKKGTGIEGSL
jgi:hypothetical protein